ncbi:M1 family metallopeptidase [Rufibacter sp. XAAS-G3-1]|uniref:M1 family metallopeptidase n=1 Tax=Rufibacter sp. XAAS-G3-1 TaxID=2729134 RepID=UPI0015E78E33|nr:M1 family metallopeptidase [Rufibacter sp. XAAS-G3-1]
MRHRLLLPLLLLFPFFAPAQQPYWQQEVNYKIDVTLDDVHHTLSATEQIEYVNNSPATLTFLYFHLWPNAYQDRSTAFARQQLVHNEDRFHFAPKEARGSISGLDFKINGQNVTWELDAQNPDIAKLTLNQPLAPGGRITISTPFQVKLPDSFSRLGHVGQSYQISQWYPKPAVFDHKGWHPMPYLDQGEFYSEFGSFDVRITLPANYTIGATGELQNPEEQARLESLAQATAAKKEFDAEDLAFPASAEATKTLHYRQDRIHDFAWFADKRFNVLKSQVTLPHSKRTVTTWLLFTNREAQKWVKSVPDINDAVYAYSLWLGDYPYAQATAVDAALSAGAGMEYPMVTVTEPEAIIHEVGHNWFYGILGSNEREHPWLDEGINSYYEFRTKARRTRYAGMVSSEVNQNAFGKFLGVDDLPPAAIDNPAYLSAASRGLDQPVTAPAARFRTLNYGTIVYLKTTQLFQYLEKYLGTARFDSAMHTYYRQWQFRHPYPEDLQTTLEKSTGESLGWFFQELLPSTTLPDAHLANVITSGGTTQVVVRQQGKLALPVQVAALDPEGKVVESHWTKPGEREQTVTFQAQGIDRVVVDPEYLFPELDRGDNQFRLRRVFPKSEPIHLQPFLGVDRIDQKQLFVAPSLGFNTYDGFQLGAAFYNSFLTEHKLNYVVTPMYGFKSSRLTGLADVRFRLPAQGFLRKVELGVQGQRFANFHTVTPSLTFQNRLTNPNTFRQQLTLAWHFVQDDFLPDFQAPRLAYLLTTKNAVSGTRFDFDVTHFRYKVAGLVGGVEPSGGTLRSGLQAGSFSPTRFRVRLENWHKYRPGKEIKLRGFVGLMAGNQTGEFVLGLAGSPDYLKQTPFFNRTDMYTSAEGLTSTRQTDRQDGGFRSGVPVVSREWMATLNLTADLPVTPLAVYLDLGRVQEQDKIFYGTGLQWSFFNNAVQIYFPVAGDNYESTFPKSFKDFRNNIRYSLSLQKLNPFRLLDELQ